MNENLKLLEEKGTSLWKDALRRLLKNKLATISGIVIIILSILAIVAPFISTYSYEEQDLVLGAVGPCKAHILGTDELGRDLFTNILYGLRISLAIGLLATIVSILIGVSYGAISGYFGGTTDNLMMRFVDILYALPYMFLVIILMVIFGKNIFILFIALGAVLWLTMARIVRGQVMSLKEKEFVLAARSIGVNQFVIVFRHLIPNSLGPIIVYATLTIPSVILQEAFLSFLGLGVQPPLSSLGVLIANGAQSMELYPWLVLFPGIILAITLFCLNFLGDGLRDALDPYMKKD
jgi:oligopeptide transport system permease protein